MLYLFIFIILIVSLCSIGTFLSYCNRLKLLDISSKVLLLSKTDDIYETIDFESYSISIYRDDNFTDFSIMVKDSNYRIASWDLYANNRIHISYLKEIEFNVFCDYLKRIDK